MNFTTGYTHVAEAFTRTCKGTGHDRRTHTSLVAGRSMCLRAVTRDKCAHGRTCFRANDDYYRCANAVCSITTNAGWLLGWLRSNSPRTLVQSFVQSLRHFFLQSYEHTSANLSAHVSALREPSNCTRFF